MQRWPGRLAGSIQMVQAGCPLHCMNPIDVSCWVVGIGFRFIRNATTTVG